MIFRFNRTVSVLTQLVTLTGNNMYQYINELKQALVTLGQIQQSLKDLKSKENNIRQMIQDWMEMNSLSKYVIEDDSEQTWKIELVTEPRISINKDMVFMLLGPDKYEQVVENKSVNKFICRKVSNGSSVKSDEKFTRKLPTAPIQNI